MTLAMMSARMRSHLYPALRLPVLLACLLAAATALAPRPAAAQAGLQTGVTLAPVRLELAEAAAQDRVIADFYRARGYLPLWTGEGEADAARRGALLAALAEAPSHGLPAARYDLPGLQARLRSVSGAEEAAAAEVALTTAFLRYASDMRAGLLVPSRAAPGIVRTVPRPDRARLLETFAAAQDPHAHLAGLPPQTPEYTQLRRARLDLERVLAAGGWGPTVPEAKLEPGDRGPAVLALRDRLVAKGYLVRGAQAIYDGALEAAVEAFQADHGLSVDGIAGPETLRALNVAPEARLAAVLVALERERWLNLPRGDRHILVNLTDFSARIMDDGMETFRTRAVVGRNTSDRRTPEFSDEMDHMVINPTWHVPHSIATRDYLPKLRQNPSAASYLTLVDRNGQTVSRADKDFSAYTASTFPYRMKQAPGRRNALGLVKFMFPNKYNIYLHDTPEKHLFARDLRTYSSGCVRLAEPFEFAYTLLAAQEADPEGYFHRVLDTGRETRVNLVDPVPVHIIYRTAVTDAKGRVQFRRDIYGRDAAVWEALSRAGVSLDVPQG